MVEDSVERLANRRSLGDEVYEILRDRIVAGQHQLGAWLRQEEIAGKLGVSQTPVREALDRLVAEGLAERVPYRGVRVTRLTDEEIADLYAARLYLESAVVRAAAYNVNNQEESNQQRENAQCEELLKVVEALAELNELEEMAQRRELNTYFHLKLAEMSGNQALFRLYQLTLHQFPDWMIYEGMFRQKEKLPERLAREVREHREILNAVVSGDAKQAGELARQHVSNLKDELAELLNVKEELLEKKVREIGLGMRR